MKSKRLLNIAIFLYAITGQSCISIKQSAYNSNYQAPLEIGTCKINSTGAVHMNIFGLIKTDFIPASIKIESAGQTIYCDPLVINDTTKADYIFITHTHPDHFSKKDIKKLADSETVLVGPVNIPKNYKKGNFIQAEIGKTIRHKHIQFQAVESYNLESKIHKPGNKFVGYVIAVDSVNIYIAGDTDYIPEMNSLKNITVAILPIGEGNTAMNPASAAKAANAIKPAMIIPIHYELNQNREKQFLDSLQSDIRAVIFTEY
ncbi:MAG: MBL fold metallo-hydrolase [Bacteroidales bacterium]|nr:MBL fold metallo-hydrolase [Bacteroidales bacterium]MBN2817683.1 MBL fold metallo-hydrolase [Bacteroidales bacterium]